jgi:hypothetical protein
MPKKKLRVVSLDEVRITRKGNAAEFEYADEALGGMTLTLGVDVSRMSDDELLQKHNETVLAMEALAASYEHVAVEVPIGSPQISYSSRCDQWTPRGDVLRCVVHDGGPNAEATIEIDDRELSLRAFGRLLTTYSGWGMRIVFVPDDELHQTPVIEVREPDDEPEAPSTRAALPASIRPWRSATTAASTDASAAQPEFLTRTQKLILRKPIYRLRVTLLGVTPPIWRSVLVSGNVSLKKLHQVIQIAMGWANSHVHVFTRANTKEPASDPRFGLEDTRDTARIKLRSFAPKVRSRFRYEYDLGDCWQHEVVVEDIVSPEGTGRTPRCVDGARACPPEDCGGIDGYATLVAAMRDRSHPEHAHFRDWLGRTFEPEQFDLEAVNDLLRRAK